MIETIYEFSLDDNAIVERLVDTKDVSIAHAVVEAGASFPKHTANADVKIILVRGVLSVIFDNQDEHRYSKGSIIAVPEGTQMEINNVGDDSAEFFAIKAPSPTFK